MSVFTFAFSFFALSDDTLHQGLLFSLSFVLLQNKLLVQFTSIKRHFFLVHMHTSFVNLHLNLVVLGLQVLDSTFNG